VAPFRATTRAEPSQRNFRIEPAGSRAPRRPSRGVHRGEQGRYANTPVKSSLGPQKTYLFMIPSHELSIRRVAIRRRGNRLLGGAMRYLLISAPTRAEAQWDDRRNPADVTTTPKEEPCRHG
jgi:hypothetical protein